MKFTFRYPKGFTRSTLHSPPFTKHLLRLLFPWCCAACGTELPQLDDHGFCGRCHLHLPRLQGLVCIRCGVPLPYGGMWCYGCKRTPVKLRVRSALLYKEGIPSAIYRFKYFGRISLANPFADLMAGIYQKQFPDPVDALVPVPLHGRVERQRGFNQASLLAAALSERLKIPWYPDILKRARMTQAQHGLNRQKRKQNLEGAFDPAVTESSAIEGKSILLIDDVCTTGSTFENCAQALKPLRPKRIQGFALARDE
jgi:ComF family protein